jgi:hypothetical protein
LPGEYFRYGGFEIDESTGVVRCRFELDGRQFEERVCFGRDRDWARPGARESARLIHLLAGVSYYKAAAPPVIDLGATPIRPGEQEFLRAFYVDGLAEFAFRNELVLDDVAVIGGAEPLAPVDVEAAIDRPLIPFGGGLDSIVTVELLTERFPDSALFILNQFDAIEPTAALTKLPIVRAQRELDPAILHSKDFGWFNGHVPITGILSTIAVTAALLENRGAVVMSNEWSASSSNFKRNGRAVNHQYSKSMAFEEAFRSVLAGAIGPHFEYFSELRPFSELWIAERFAPLDRYRETFHSCNRAFHQDPSRRQRAWCGECDKCCFIDLVLAPFVDAASLRAIFDGPEPLDNLNLLEQFKTLLDLSEQPKPFECVGDVEECRAAATMAKQRPDRRTSPVLTALNVPAATTDLFRPLGPHHIPDAFFPATALG